MALTQDQFFQAVASRQIPRVRIAGIVVNDGKVLVQKPADDPSSCYAFIGSEYEVPRRFHHGHEGSIEECSHRDQNRAVGGFIPTLKIGE